jgi:hypothetical protein
MSDKPYDVTQDLASALIRGGVWDEFIALPRELQGEFIMWVDAAAGIDNRTRRLRTLVGLLRKQAGLPGIKDDSGADQNDIRE